MTQLDDYGLQITTGSATARDAYAEGVRRFLAADGGIEAVMAEAIAADEAFALPHVALARVHQMKGRAADIAAPLAEARKRAADASEMQHRRVSAELAAGHHNVARSVLTEELRVLDEEAAVRTTRCSHMGRQGVHQGRKAAK